jgi:hypothetical protein
MQFIGAELHGAVLLEKLIVTKLFKKFPTVSGTRKVHYRVHKNPLLVPILSSINPVYTLPPYFSKMHSNTLPSKTSVSEW